MFRTFSAACALLLLGASGYMPAKATEGPVVEVHFSPTENLEKIDVALLGSAKHSIDMAAYVLSDWVVIDALRQAEKRGVTVRIVIDTSQHHAFDKMIDLADNIRVKDNRVYMHLKSYVIDGALLRAGAANFSASGLKQQDNDLIVIRETTAIRSFEREFNRLWSAGKPLFEHDRAMRAMDGKTIEEASKLSR